MIDINAVIEVSKKIESEDFHATRMDWVNVREILLSAFKGQPEKWRDLQVKKALEYLGGE